MKNSTIVCPVKMEYVSELKLYAQQLRSNYFKKVNNEQFTYQNIKKNLWVAGGSFQYLNPLRPLV